MKPMTVPVRTKLYQIKKILDEFVQLGIRVENGHPTKEHDEFIYIKVNLFGRYVHRLEAISLLLPELESNPTIEDTIGLVIRGCLADLIPMFYLEVLQSHATNEEGEDEMIGQARAFLCDHLFSFLTFLKDYRTAGVYTEKIYKEAVDKLKSDWPYYFSSDPMDYDHPEKSIDAKRFPKNSHLIRYVRSHESNELFRINGLYELYSFYSKYEHFGIFTNSMQTMDMDIQAHRIFDSIWYIILGSWFCIRQFHYAFNNVEEEEKRLIELKIEFEKLLAIGRNE
jgi:hypothetical protein